MSSRVPEAVFCNLEIKLQYGKERPLDWFIDSKMLSSAVSAVKTKLLALDGLSYMREPPEYLELAVVLGADSEVVVMEDGKLLKEYYDQLCRGHLVKLRARRHTFLNDLTYYLRRVTDVFPAKVSVVLAVIVVILCLVWLFCGANTT